MNEKDIKKSFEEVEKLLAEQYPYDAIEILDSVLNKLDKSQEWFKGRCLFWKQLCYKQTLEIKKAHKCGNEAVKIFRKLGDKVQVSTVLRDTASLYEHIGQYAKALQYIDYSLEELGDQEVLIALAMSLAKRGKFLSQLNDNKGAESALLGAEKIIDASSHTMHRLTVSTHLMEFYTRQKEFRKAEYYANKSEVILKRLQRESGYLNEIRYSQIQASRSIIALSRGFAKEAVMRLRNFVKFGVTPKRKRSK